MGRDKKVEAAVLNITIHPHSKQKYIDIFYKMHEMKISSKIRDKSYGLIGWIDSIDGDDDENGMHGEIYKYLNIDPFAPWLNKRSLEEVDIDSEKDKPPVSEEMKPHLEKIYFHFYPKKHRLIFNINKFSPITATKFFESMLSDDTFSKDFNFSEVTIESKKEAIDSILRMHRLSWLEITIKRPNSDDDGECNEKDILELLEEEHARTFFQKKTAPRGESLKPNEETKKLMMVAKSNGKIDAQGYNELDQRVKESTVNHPLIETISYDPERGFFTGAFRELASVIMAKISS